MEASVVAGLTRIRRRRATFILMWLAFVPLFTGISKTAKLFALDFDRLVPVVAPVYGGLWVLSGLVWSFSRCPRCTELFFHRFPLRRTFSRCAHCDLPLEPNLRLGRRLTRLIAVVVFLLALALLAFAVLIAYGVTCGISDGRLGFVAVLLAALAAYCCKLGAKGWRTAGSGQESS